MLQALLAALPALIQAGGTIGAGFLGQKDNELTPEQRAQYQLNMALGQNQLDWQNYLMPKQEGLGNELYPALLQQLQSGGQLPPELEQQIWGLAQRRQATGYNQLENQLGSTAAGRGVLQGGPTMQNWLDKVGLARSQGTQDMATNQAMSDYGNYQKAIGNAMGMFGGNQFGGGNQAYINNQPAETDWSGIGALFSKGGSALSDLFSGLGKGTTPGATNWMQDYNGGWNNGQPISFGTGGWNK